MILRIRTYIWAGGDGGDDDADNDDHGGDDDAHDDDEDDKDADDDENNGDDGDDRAHLYKASAMQTLIDGVPHSLHFQFTARCNRRCLLIAIVTAVPNGNCTIYSKM